MKIEEKKANPEEILAPGAIADSARQAGQG
jgi:hypothetical protein